MQAEGEIVGLRCSLVRMPIYEYERGDGTRFELRQGFSDDALETDPETGAKVSRVFSAPKIIYQGTGGSLSTAYRSRPKDETASES